MPIDYKTVKTSYDEKQKITMPEDFIKLLDQMIVQTFDGVKSEFNLSNVEVRNKGRVTNDFSPEKRKKFWALVEQMYKEVGWKVTINDLHDTQNQCVVFRFSQFATYENTIMNPVGC